MVSKVYATGITSKSMEETKVNGRHGNGGIKITRKTTVGRSMEKTFECV